ncbi:integrin beta-6-like [Paramuricea clavata]|uniref:Integrin beta n=1 Tax=Paramuricea clavata TaxID=317549 RepID=A0A6S7JJW1_PARCT|nr:integrin beta-6-like [Paramuricea clavata]
MNVIYKNVLILGNCEELESNKCLSCLQLAGCAWCSDVNYTSTRCNTPQQHAIFQCNMTVNGNPDPKPTLEKEKLTDLNQITPKKVSSRVRVGEPVKFKIEIEPSKNYPVDFYILMDLTATMKDDLNNVKKLALDISAKLRELTNRSRLAFGSFVDKPVAPYLRHEE